MNHTLVPTAELIGSALDWAVAQALGYVEHSDDATYGYTRWLTPERTLLCYPFRPSIIWSQGGPIIELKRISTVLEFDTGQWLAGLHGHWGGMSHRSDTPLVAAMRCYVASELGGEVEVSSDLLGD